MYPSLWGKIGNYSAWSWGISRLIDGITQVKDQLKIDSTKIAVHGCSYAGKMALFGGALDERVALTVVEESGGGGIDSLANVAGVHGPHRHLASRRSTTPTTPGS